MYILDRSNIHRHSPTKPYHGRRDADGCPRVSRLCVYNQYLHSDVCARLPKQFGSTSDKPEVDHVASNVEASASNAEVGPAPVLEVKSTPDEPSLPEAAFTPSLPTTNGLHADLPMNGVPADSGEDLPAPAYSSPQPPVDSEPPQLPTQDAPISSNTTSFADSVVPSSVPAEAQSSLMTTESSQPIMEPIQEPVPQPPISDLRSPPHADELSAAQVAEAEAQKHAEDNAAVADIPPAVDIVEPLPVSEPVSEPVEDFTSDVEPAPIQRSIPEANQPTPPINDILEPVKVSETGLATPPAQSPPPAPEPAHAELPVEVESVVNDPVPAITQQEQPAEPAPTPAEPANVAEASADQEMVDAPALEIPPTKVAREREDDELDSERSAKRMKTDEPEASFKVPEVPAAASPSPAVSTPAPSTPNASGEIAPDGDNTITAPRLSHMKKVISNLKKSNASTAFRQPVDYKALNIPSYPEIVKTPMDLSKIDQKLKNGTYTGVSEFVADFDLIVANCVAFNGREHGITVQAIKMQNSFQNQMKQLPKAQFAEPSKEEKKLAKLKQEPTRTAPPRRPSVSTTAPPPPVVSQSPKPASATTPAFAPGPDGVPLIRRDSNMTDGRPKRQIVPPKRNQEFAGGRPKKKKYELQLRFCQEVIKELTSGKHWQMNQYFTHPVDPVALNIPTYYQVIKKPMDLGTVETKLNNNVYEKAKDFEEDVRLVFKNCYKFNPDSDWVNQAGHQLEDLFNAKWATKDEWIASREPPSEPQSEVEDEDDEESEDEADDSEDDRNDKIARLQQQIAEMSKQMGELTQVKTGKKKKSTPPSAPTSKKSKNKNKKEKSKSIFPGLQKAEKKKSVSKPKPEKEKWVTFQEKQYISNGIAMLPEKQMSEALKIIQQSVPALADSNESEIELDIEEVPNHALIKLLNFVKRYAGPPPEETQKEESSFSAPSAPPKSKKNKPMSKTQQQAQINELRGKLSAYAAGPTSPGAIESIENDDSSDDDDSEESEED